MSMSPGLAATNFDAVSGLEADELYPSLQEPLQSNSDEWLHQVLPDAGDFSGFV